MISKAARAFPAGVLSGPRWAGKTTLLRHAFAKADYRLLEDPAVVAAENAGEDIAAPVDHAGIDVAAGGDQADVFGNRRVCRTGPLAVDDPVEGVGISDIGGLHHDPRCWLAGRAGLACR